jgi:hypothetical protein
MGAPARGKNGAGEVVYGTDDAQVSEVLEKALPLSTLGSRNVDRSTDLSLDDEPAEEGVEAA